jgi:ribosomal protein S18 acetylase RimI-like enzyme
VSGFVVRPATVDDAAGIARVHIRSWRETYAPLVEPGELDGLSVERRAERWARDLADGSEAWVAECDGEVIGFSSTSGDHAERPRPVELGMLYVMAESHGNGAGQALLDAAIGDSPAFLFVARDNPRAIRFYERNSFAFDGVSEQFAFRQTPIVSLRMVR